MSAPTGNRKFKFTIIMAGFLTAGFVFSVLAHATPDLFVTFATGIGALSGGFIYGNVKEHQAQKT